MGCARSQVTAPCMPPHGDCALHAASTGNKRRQPRMDSGSALLLSGTACREAAPHERSRRFVKNETRVLCCATFFATEVDYWTRMKPPFVKPWWSWVLPTKAYLRGCTRKASMQTLRIIPMCGPHEINRWVHPLSQLYRDEGLWAWQQRASGTTLTCSVNISQPRCYSCCQSQQAEPQQASSE